MARRSRTARRSETAENLHLPSPHIRRSLPFFDILNEEQLLKLDGQVDWILENIGVCVS